MSMTDTEAATAAPAAELAAALAAVQAELPEIKKTRTAKVEKDGRTLYTYDYADLADVSIAILPILGKHGLAFMAVPGHQPDGKFGLRYYLLHSSGAQVEGFYEIAEQGGMQMVGGRITYARRYCLCAVTGVAAEDDVDARDDGSGSGGNRRMQRRQQPTADRSEQQPQHTARRRARPETASPPQAASPVAAPVPPSQGAGEASLPPLPGEEDAAPAVPDETAPSGPAAGADPTTSGASYSARVPGSGSRAKTAGPSQSSPGGSATAPDDTDYDTPGTVTTPQITAIWTVLSNVYKFASDEKEQARTVCAHIVNHDLESTKNLSRNEAKAILDTLGHWGHAATTSGEHPRDYLIATMAAQEDARDGEVPGGE